MKPFHSFLFPRIRKVNANFRNGGVLSAIVEPLTNLLHKHREFQWSSESKTAFLKVKGILTHHPVLTAPDFTKPFKLAVDASDVRAGAVLLQDDDKGIDHPVCYFSKKFTDSQKRYCTTERN